MRAVLGPYVRGVWPDGACFWVELDGPARVTVEVTPEGRGAWRAAAAPTVQVGRRHYARVDVRGLRPATWHSWRASVEAGGGGAAGAAAARLPEHRLPGQRGLWLRTLDEPGAGWTGRYRFAHGSCRKARHAPESSGQGGGPGPDVLSGFARWLAERAARRAVEWPRFLMLTGDQVYADECDDFIVARILDKRRRLGGPPPLPSLETLHPGRARAGRRGVHPADLEEYALLYEHAWGFAGMQQVLANVPSFMMFDDHDVTDDWNITRAWRDQARREPWRSAVVAAQAAYWLYQGWGNLDPAALRDDPRDAILRDAAGAGVDAAPRLLQLLGAALAAPATLRWYYEVHAPFPLRVADTRTERVYPAGADLPAQRLARIMSPAQMEWLTAPARAGAGCSVVVTPGPFLVWPLITVAAAAFRLGRPGEDPSALGRVLGAAAALSASDVLSVAQREEIVRTADMEFWPVFFASFQELSDLVKQLDAGGRSLLMITGDVHCAFTIAARPAGAPGSAAASRRPPPLLQLVGSSMQNHPTGGKRTALKLTARAARGARLGGLDFGYVPFDRGDLLIDNNLALVDLVRDARGVWLQERYLTAAPDGRLTVTRTMRALSAPFPP
ncbi:MAG TPA: hypothetical protein VG389_24155 [Myxococcota bacterium]|nr:hypothetical protein [Myxococcota bacterium]